MPSELEKEFVKIISGALHECNEIIGYEYFRAAQIGNIAKNFVKTFPLIEELMLKPRGVTIADIEKEQHDYDKGKRAALMGILDGHVFRGYEGNTFKEKFKNYIYDPGITDCKWIRTTDYDKYLQTLLHFVSEISSNKTLQFIYDYKRKKLVSISQGIVRIFKNKKFFKDEIVPNENTVDEAIDIFRELGAVAEHHLKLLYAIKYGYSSEHRTFPSWKTLSFTQFGGTSKKIRF